MNSASVNIHVQVFFFFFFFPPLVLVYCFLGYLWVELPSYMIISCLTFWATVKLFSHVCIILIPPSNAQIFQFLHTLCNVCYLPFMWARQINVPSSKISISSSWKPVCITLPHLIRQERLLRHKLGKLGWGNNPG